MAIHYKMQKKRNEEEEDEIGLLDYDHNKDMIAMQASEQRSPVPITVKRDGNKRYCQKCRLEKFDRTHHCRQCKKCVLKMDQQLCKNRSTIEYYEKTNYRMGGASSRDIMRSKYFNPWDIGTRKNIEQVLGKGSLWQKLLPIGKTLGDGSSFPINSYAYDTLATDDTIEF
ncbi:hypothetical protein [Parasitella parasitica]|uniref:Palmitoyltransferase n=1 Tax=Parasitella parasitica TaxID=35722 RepID=A0A0B7NI04_9FUNG|nr:hypothetical protein [Parasitella parasitica]